MKRPVLYVKGTANTRLVKRWITRVDSTNQRYGVDPTLAIPKNYRIGSPPTRRHLLTDDMDKRIAFAAAYLRKNHPVPHARGNPRIVVPMPEALHGLPINPAAYGSAAMFYYYGEHAIFLMPEGLRLLGSHREQEWVAGIYRLAHEWYHAMRLHPEIITALEEGSAEIFARRVGERMTGAEHPVYAVDDYAPYTSGVQKIALALGEPSYRWVLGHRAHSVPQTIWMKSTLTKLGVGTDKWNSILYDTGSADTWHDALQKALDGM